MIHPEYVQTMSRYNQWQNNSLYSAADGLSREERLKDQGSFFGSIQRTLCHLLWGDQIWMSRLSDTAPPTATNIQASADMISDWQELLNARTAFDLEIIRWADNVTQDKLSGDLTWFSGAAQRDVSKPLAMLVTHMFNHQTHHRGQVHAMLTALNAKPDDTDLFLLQ